MKRIFMFAALAVAAFLVLSDVGHVLTIVAHYSSGIAAPAAMAMLATPPAAFRGLRSVRAEGDPKAVFEELHRTVEAFKEAHTKELADIKAKMADVVQSEKVDRINTDITKLNGELDKINISIAAMKLGGPGDGAPNADVAAHATAFDNFFRHGVEAGLHDLAVKAGLTTQSKPDGGFVVPTRMESTIDRVLGKVSVLRSLSRVISISEPTYKKQVNMGGATSGWVGEEDDRTETATPKLRELEFPVMEIYAEPWSTQIALDDAVMDLEGWLADEVSIEFAEQEGGAFVAGNGIKRPRGLLSYEKVANASYSWGKIGYVASGAANGFVNPSATVSPADCLIDVMHALKPGYRSGASWLTSDVNLATLRKFKDGQGNYLWVPPTVAEAPGTILGKPVHTDDNMPSVEAGAFPLAFGDFKRAYLVIDRQGIRILRNPYKVNGKVSFYTTKRVGGGVQNFEAVKLLKIGAS